MGDQEDQKKYLDQLYAEYLQELKALIDFIGPKEAAAMLRPDRFSKDTEAGQRWLADCVNPNKRDKICGFDELRLQRAGSLKGYHKFKHFVDKSTGYQPSTPKPISDEKADLMEEIRQKQNDFQKQLDRMAGLNQLEKGKW